MGLKLIRTLVTKMGGELYIGPNPATTGTVIHLKLKMLKIEPEGEQSRDLKRSGE